MIPIEIQTCIREELAVIEEEHDCRVLLAVESGSRAWGFPSRDSDYDVRFIYLHRRDWYLSVDLEDRRDVIERPIKDDLDISGWDIRKTLRLFAKSNPPLLEWLGSPIVYSDAFGFASELRAQLPEFYSPTKSAYHYLHMAQGNYRNYLNGDIVWLKKYLYALRPLLAVRWLEQKRGVVPMEFTALLITIEDRKDLVEDIEALVTRKIAGEELDRAAAIPTISRFISDEVARLEHFTLPVAPRGGDFGSLNVLFRSMLERAWGSGRQ